MVDYIKNTTFPSNAIKLFGDCVRNSRTFLKSDSILIFVCGSSPNSSNHSGRTTLIKYAEKHFPKFNFFMAEKFFDVYQNETANNLLELEEEIAQFSDCLIIVLESAGAIAELGAFSMDNRLAKKVLVINEKRFRDEISFIAQGPIAKLDKVSEFKPMIYANIASISTAIPEIENRLKIISRKYNKKVSFQDYESFSQLQHKNKMLFLLDIISLYHPLTHRELIDILSSVFGEKSFDIQFEIGMLITLTLVIKKDNYYVRTRNDQKLFFQYKGMNEMLLRSQIINHIHKYDRNRINLLKK